MQNHPPQTFDDMWESRAAPAEPSCEFHESFFRNSFYLQIENFQGYLTKSMSPSLKGRSCSCADRTPVLYTIDIDSSPPSVNYSEPEADTETSMASLFNENPSFDAVTARSESPHENNDSPPVSATASPTISTISISSDGSEFSPSSEVVQDTPRRRVLRTTTAQRQASNDNAGPETRRSSPMKQLRKRLPSCSPTAVTPEPRRVEKKSKKPQRAKAKAKRPTTKANTQNKKGDDSMRVDNILFSDSEAGRIARNKFLVEKRKQGMAYADIKALGRFPEAESTLRGRYRTLTKQKGDRVRKPQWTQEDIRLLPLAVETACDGQDPARVHIPWEKVAMIMFDNGASYRFGSGACHKMWDQVRKGTTG